MQIVFPMSNPSRRDMSAMVRQAAAHLANTYCLGVEAGGADGVGVGAGGAGCLGVGAGRAGCLSLSSYKDILIKQAQLGVPHSEVQVELG